MERDLGQSDDMHDASPTVEQTVVGVPSEIRAEHPAFSGDGVLLWSAVLATVVYLGIKSIRKK